MTAGKGRYENIRLVGKLNELMKNLKDRGILCVRRKKLD